MGKKSKIELIDEVQILVCTALLLQGVSNLTLNFVLAKAKKEL